MRHATVSNRLTVNVLVRSCKSGKVQYTTDITGNDWLYHAQVFHKRVILPLSVGKLEIRNEKWAQVLYIPLWLRTLFPFHSRFYSTVCQSIYRTVVLDWVQYRTVKLWTGESLNDGWNNGTSQKKVSAGRPPRLSYYDEPDLVRDLVVLYVRVLSCGARIRATVPLLCTCRPSVLQQLYVWYYERTVGDFYAMVHGSWYELWASFLLLHVYVHWYRTVRCNHGLLVRTALYSVQYSTYVLNYVRTLCLITMMYIVFNPSKVRKTLNSKA